MHLIFVFSVWINELLKTIDNNLKQPAMPESTPTLAMYNVGVDSGMAG
ncbi:MAG: hypothetical protein KGV50_01865 [Gammaproteobacteria bacterium]|nr:hypothetical protein [Gammaproteobacteria bacterium]